MVRSTPAVPRRGRRWKPAVPCRPYFPAAFPDVIGVGGFAAPRQGLVHQLRRLGRRLRPAVDVVSTFLLRFDETLHATDSSARTAPTVSAAHGWARWSGTSFAAPKVAALIAQEMYLNPHAPARPYATPGAAHLAPPRPPPAWTPPIVSTW